MIFWNDKVIILVTRNVPHGGLEWKRRRKKNENRGGNPGPRVMGGLEFESRHRILNGHFSHLFVKRICLKRRK